MRLKTPAQTYSLRTAADYLRVSASQLRDSGEPALALAVLSLARKADLARDEAVVVATLPVVPTTRKDAAQ